MLGEGEVSPVLCSHSAQVSYLTLNLLMECDFADVDSDTSKTDETLAVFDLTTS